MSGPAVAAAERCPRCGGSFDCGMNDASPCPCTTVTLQADLQASLRQRYTGCLCLACLRALSAESGAGQILRSTTLPTE